MMSSLLRCWQKAEDKSKIHPLVLTVLHGHNEKGSRQRGEVLDIRNNSLYLLPKLYAHRTIIPKLTNKDSST